MNFESVLLTKLNPERSIEDPSTVAFKHSGFGAGKRLEPSKHIEFCWRRNSGKRKKKEDVVKVSEVYNTDVSNLCVLQLYFSMNPILCQGSINQERVMEMGPECKLFQKTESIKSELKTKLAKAGEGAGLAKVRQRKRRNRMIQWARTFQETIKEGRENMRKAELFICDERCPRTNRYCLGVFLTEQGLNDHKCDFPFGENARDYIIREASANGGLVEVGSRPDRQNRDALFSQVMASEAGARG